MPPDPVLPELCGDFDGRPHILPGSSCRTGPGYRIQVCPEAPAPLFCGVWVTDAALDATIANQLDQLIGQVEAADVPASLLLPAHAPMTTELRPTSGSPTAMPKPGCCSRFGPPTGTRASRERSAKAWI